MNVQPLGDRALVKLEKEQETTASGIVLPDTVEKKTKARGEVIALGHGEDLAKLGLQVGDTILFGKFAGDEVEIDGVEHKILEDDDILAVIK